MEKSDLHDELKAIYTEKNGEMPDLTSLDRRSDSRLTRWLVRTIVVLFVIAAAAWGGFFLWSRGIFQGGKPLQVSMEGPSEANVGQPTYFTIRYENKGDVPISHMEMKLNLPIGFTISSTTPEATKNQTWTLGSLSAGSDGSVVVRGTFRSEVPSFQTLQAFFTYRPSNFTSDFQELVTAKVELVGSVIRLAVSGPEKALPGDELTYVINAENSGTEMMTGVRISAILPEGFAITTTEIPPSVKPVADVPEWDIAIMNPGELVPITIRGRYTASISGERIWKAHASLRTEEGIALAQGDAQTITDLLGGNLAFHLIVNGSTDKLTAKLGEQLRVSIDYANNGNETIEHVAFTLRAATDAKALPIDWAKAELAGGSRTDGLIVWDEINVKGFAAFAPSASGSFDLTLPLLGAIDPASVADRLRFTLTVSLTKVGSVESPRTIETSPIEIAINSDMQTAAEARYYTSEGEAIGTGPLPPKVGETTSYRITWSVANTLHDLTGFKMTTNLPPDVAWKNSQATDIGTVTFDQTTRIVTWAVDKLPTSIPAAEANFDVAITPESADVGSYFKLTNATAASATDDATKMQVSDALDILNTELPSDVTAKGKGVVEK